MFAVSWAYIIILSHWSVIRRTLRC